MGLDMYLEARKNIQKIDWSKVKEAGDMYNGVATTPEYISLVESAGLSHVVNSDVHGVTVSVHVAYWRKANQIHSWFVENVQNGEDDCKEYFVSNEQLQNLLEICKDSYARKDPGVLTPKSGFFFGSTDIDEWYWESIKNTIEQLERIVALPEFDDLSFYYQSSW